MNLAAVILAGGESRRMGRDKAFLELAGRPMITRALDVVRELDPQEIFISGRAGVDYSGLACPVLLDLEPGFGPLGGIERALDAARSPLVLVLAVDLPHMSAALLRKLAGHCGPLTGAIPRLAGELEPLAAIYPKRCHVYARDCLVKFRCAARDFALACLHEHAIRSLAISRADAPRFKNLNCLSDLPASLSGSPCH
jgi:molybdenum cofactor guanylyltransferase